MSLDHVSVLVANMTDLETAMSLAALVDRSGYDRIWLAETNAIDAAALGGAIARETSLEIGTAIVPVYSRTPALLAMMAGTWSALAGGRGVHLGIGAGGQAIVESWHGVPFDGPLGTVADTIEILRQAFAGERTSHEGDRRRSRGFRLGYGPQPLARVYIGGMGPKMQQLAAEKADGLIVTWLSPRVLQDFSAQFGRNVVAAGRARDAARLVARVYVAVTDDVDGVREQVRREMVEYIVSPPYARYFSSVGFDDEVTAVNDAFSCGDREGTAAAVSDRLLDDVLVVGRGSEEVRDRLQAYLDAGADDLMVQPVPPARGGDPARTVTAVADALR
jgi:probable F420-dependent oxidoreductase